MRVICIFPTQLSSDVGQRAGGSETQKGASGNTQEWKLLTGKGMQPRSQPKEAGNLLTKWMFKVILSEQEVPPQAGGYKSRK